MKDKIALLVIDVQKGLFERSAPIHRADELLSNINVLVDRAHQAGATVIYIQHYNKTSLLKDSNAWRLHPRLQPIEGDVVIHKQHGNAFEETSIDTELSQRGIGRIVVTGLVTQGCVKATCIGGKESGYKVTLVRDGHSNMNKRAAKTIEEWNRKLSHGIAELKWHHELDFSMGSKFIG